MTDVYTMGDFTYGEWIFMEEGRPRFYYRAFDADGEDRAITVAAEINGGNCGDFVLEMLKQAGYGKVSHLGLPRCLHFSFERRSRLEKVELLQVVDKR